MKRLAIGVSGGGTTFEAITKAIQNGDIDMELTFVFADRECGALKKAEKLSVKAIVRNEDESINDFHERILSEIEKQKIDVIALAGYLRNFPVTNTDNFMVINSHPAAIPYFGGKGMYGSYVHEAVYDWMIRTGWAHPYTYSTVHVATEDYDEGEKLGIVPLKVEKSDTPESIAAKLLPLEHENYIQVLKGIAEDKIVAKEYPQDYLDKIVFSE